MSYSQPVFYQANCYEYFLNNEQQIIHDSSIVSTLPPALASTQYPPLNTATLASDNAIAIAEFPTMQCVSHSFGILMQVNTLVHEANRIDSLVGDDRTQSKARITAAISWLVEHGILLTGTIGNYSGSPLAVNAGQLASGLHGLGTAASITATGYRLNQTRHALKIQRWNTSDGCAAEFLNMMDRLRLGRNLAADVSMVLSQLGFLAITLATSFTPLSLATRLLAYSPCALLSLYHMFNKKMTAHLNSESNLLLNVAKLLISKKIELNALLLEYRTSSCIWLNALTGIRSYSPKLEQKFLKKIVTILKSHDNPICEMTIDDIYQNKVGNYFLKSEINETTVLAQFINLIIKYRNNDNLKSKGFSPLFNLKIHESQISKKIIEPLIENIAICEKLTLFTSKYFVSKNENQRLWNNVPCVFTTANIENDFGDSTYTVSINEMKRHAPINTKRYPHLLNNNNSYICYFDPQLRNTLLQNHFKQLHIYFEGISDNIIVFKIINMHDETQKYFKASTIPKIGLKVIDFNVDKQGKLTDRHIGHEINNILK